MGRDSAYCLACFEFAYLLCDWEAVHFATHRSLLCATQMGGKAAAKAREDAARHAAEQEAADCAAREAAELAARLAAEREAAEQAARLAAEAEVVQGRSWSVVRRAAATMRWLSRATVQVSVCVVQIYLFSLTVKHTPAPSFQFALLSRTLKLHVHTTRSRLALTTKHTLITYTHRHPR